MYALHCELQGPGSMGFKIRTWLYRRESRPSFGRIEESFEGAACGRKTTRGTHTTGNGELGSWWLVATASMLST